MANETQACARLRQLNRAGIDQAAAMLSQLLRQPVTVESVDACPGGQQSPAGEAAEAGLGIALAISGELNGGMLVFFSQARAEGWCAHLLGQPVSGNLLAEPAASTLKEIGNIIASAYLASLDTQLRVRALPSPPQGFFAPVDQLLAQQQAGLAADQVVRCCFNAGDSLRAALYLFAEAATLELLAEKLAAQHS